MNNIINLNKFKSHLLKFKGKPKGFIKELCTDNFIQSSLGVNEKDMERIYHQGHQFFSAHNYQQAATNFLSLAMFDRSRVEYWLSLAHTLFFMEKYDKAIEAYAYASLLNAEDPTPHYYGGICLLTLGNLKEALVTLEVAIDLAGKSSIYEEIEIQAKKQRDDILKQKGAKL